MDIGSKFAGSSQANGLRVSSPIESERKRFSLARFVPDPTSTLVTEARDDRECRSVGSGTAGEMGPSGQRRGLLWSHVGCPQLIVFCTGNVLCYSASPAWRYKLLYTAPSMQPRSYGRSYEDV